MAKSAILVIDAQVGPFSFPPEMYRAEETLAAINRLTQIARSHSMPVIFIQHIGPEGSPMAPGSPAWQVHPALLARHDDLYINKTHGDAFHNTDLQATLDNLEITTLYLSGYATELCVDTTARRASVLGYKTILVSDAHTTKNRPSLQADQIIAHHHWVLSNVACPGNQIIVNSTNEIEHGINVHASIPFHDGNGG